MAVDTTVADARNERLLVWAREHGEEFRGGQAADALGVKVQGIGPVLASMVRAGDLTMSYHGSTRMYAVAEEQAEETPTIDPGKLSDPEFETGLKDELSGYLTELNVEKEQIASRQQVVEDEIDKVQAAIGKLA
jgi:hypothetical protein